MTDAAANLAKYKGLENKEIEHPHLAKAIPKIREVGEQLYKEALEIVETLNQEDKDKFWERQMRNKNAKSFEELITKKEFEKQTWIASQPNTPAPNPVAPKETNVDAAPLVKKLEAVSKAQQQEQEEEGEEEEN